MSLGGVIEGEEVEMGGRVGIAGGVGDIVGGLRVGRRMRGLGLLLILIGCLMRGLERC